jgi:hypothetical protein
VNGIPIEAGGKAYKLIYTTNSLCALEEKSGLSINELTAGMGEGKGLTATRVRLLVWGALTEHHPETTLRQAGSIIDEVGFANVAALISRVLVHSFPAPVEAGEGGERPLAPKATVPSGRAGARS